MKYTIFDDSPCVRYNEIIKEWEYFRTEVKVIYDEDDVYKPKDTHLMDEEQMTFVLPVLKTYPWTHIRFYKVWIAKEKEGN